jgi:hypothetical protein
MVADGADGAERAELAVAQIKGAADVEPGRRHSDYRGAAREIS